LIFKLGIASVSFFAAVLVYSFARIYPPEILASIQATHPGLAAQTGLFGSAPSFFYTLALGLFVGLCASTQRGGRLHCLLWLSLVLLLESTQHPVIASLLVTWLPNTLPASAWELVGPYWLQFRRLILGLQHKRDYLVARHPFSTRLLWDCLLRFVLRRKGVVDYIAFYG
jgi:hypothetical protein